MIKLKGADPETVLITDLSDKVYYGQEKIFSESQYSRSNDLKKEIKRGRLIVVSRTPETFGGFEVPEASANQIYVPEPPRTLEPAKTPEPLESSLASSILEKFDLLLKKVESLELAKSDTPVSEGISQSRLKEEILSVLKESEVKVVKEEKRPEESQETIKGMLGELLIKVNNISNDSGRVDVTLGRDFEKDLTPRRVEEVYIPNIKVEDAKSHINLEVRVIENKDDFSNSLDMLKKLKGA
jgi:hypothetical protein